MTRAECERQIATHMEAIIKIAKKYNPKSKYLDLCFIEQNGFSSYTFNNRYYGEDAAFPINFNNLRAKRWESLTISKDPVTETYEIMIDGEPWYEHLTEDEFAEVMHQLLTERKEK